MTYYNFHAIAKRLIKEGHCLIASIFSSYHNIRPALVFYFDNHKPMPIREYMWKDYLPLIKEHNITLENKDEIQIDI